ncbi:caspase family protein [Candidatus Pelagibacter sp.]|uniref:caspase family protein n=1 Tax=Candidatus Pelagibacter sp. TaxID=2024849 RepID=UPI003F82D6F0
MKKLNLLIFFVLITILTSDISTQADIKNKELYFELENKAVKNEDSLKDILEFSSQLKKSGEVNYKGKIYNISLQKDNLSIGGKERRVVGINIINKDSLHILEQYFIAYNNDRSIDYFKLSDVKDANKDSWIITDYPVDYEGWALERRYYEDKKKNIQYGGWKQKDSDKWIFGALNPADPKSGSKETWLTWGTEVKYIESHAGLSKKEQKKLYRIAEKRFEEASEVKKLLINIKKKYYAQIRQNNFEKKLIYHEKNSDLVTNFLSRLKNSEVISKNLGNINENIKNAYVIFTKDSDLISSNYNFTYKDSALNIEIERHLTWKDYVRVIFSDKKYENEHIIYHNYPEEKKKTDDIKKYKIFAKSKNFFTITDIVNGKPFFKITDIDTGDLEIWDKSSANLSIPLVLKIGENYSGLCENPNDYYNSVYKYSCETLYANLIKETRSAHKKVREHILSLENALMSSIKNENKFVFNDEKYYALIIGNNNYQHLEKLDAAENDAVVIADVLKKKYGFEVDLLLNADYDQTVNSLFKITDKLKRNDNLLIYYAGHGELDKDENRGYWLPVDASYEMRSKWISNQRIVDRIKATKAKHVLLVADSCFSGTLMRSGGNLEKEESIDEKYIKRLKNKKTRLVITSGGNEPVVDSVGGEHSLFALKFIDTLKNSNNVINSQILFENVRRYVVANADQTPERAMVHKTGHDGGDFLFFPKK